MQYDYLWFNELNKPVLSPPAEIFPPVWGILYFMIIVSFFLFAFKKTSYKKINGYILSFIQILLNILWTPVFFTYKNIYAALIVLILLDIMVFFNIKEFFRISKASGILLIPYFLWILFATYLNIGFIVLN